MHRLNRAPLAVRVVVSVWTLTGVAYAEGATEPPGGSDAADAELIWRKPERDAANSLYFLLRFYQHSADYHELVTALGGDERVSFVRMKRVANDSGFSSGVYRIDPDELREFREPVIAYVEGGGLGEGSFVVVLNAGGPRDTEANVLLLESGIASIRFVAMDEFRRSWSGHVLMRRRGASGSSWPWGLGGCLAGMLGVFVVRRPASFRQGK